MKTQKIIIKISHYKDGKEKVRAYSTMPNIGVQAYAKLIADHPRRIKPFKRVKVKRNVINLFSRIGYIFKAIRQACSKSFVVEDIPRHQHPQGADECIIPQCIKEELCQATANSFLDKKLNMGSVRHYKIPTEARS